MVKYKVLRGVLDLTMPRPKLLSHNTQRKNDFLLHKKYFKMSLPGKVEQTLFLLMNELPITYQYYVHIKCFM